MPFPHRLLLLALWLICTSLAAQPIYRVVDEHGNVTYTDQKPDDNSQPLTLPDINVISNTSPTIDGLIEGQSETGGVEPFQMAIAEPLDGSIIANDAGQLDIRFESNLDIPPAAQLVVFLNDQAQAPIRSLELSLTDLTPGDYKVRAELQTPSGRVLAESDAISVRLISTDSG